MAIEDFFETSKPLYDELPCVANLMMIMLQNGYLATPREGNYRLHSIVKYGCDRGFWMAGE